MAFDVFSQVRCPSPDKKDTAIKNYKHIFYISNRKHCLKNEYGNTLFGTIYDFDSIDKTSNKEISNYIYEKSKKGTNIYRGIVSLAEQDAINQGLTNRESWENMFIDSISQVAKNLGISFANLEWVATVHYKKGNPHLHYVLWDREQKVKDPFIKVSTQHKIRNAFKRSIYKDYYIEMMNNKNQAKKDLRAEQIRQEFKAIDKNYCNSKIAYINLDKKITEFYESIYKEKMLYHADIEAHKILGNQLLRYFKDERYRYYSIEQIIQDLYYLLSQNEEKEKAFLQMYVFNKDLSIYAKREYAFKQKFSKHIERGM